MESISDIPSNGADLFHHRAKIKDLRSRVTNGKRVFAIGGDGRGAWTRRWKDICDAYLDDLGGPETLSQAQVGLCRHAAALGVELEQLEARMSEGKLSPPDLDLYGRLVSHLRRILETIGIERRTRVVESSVVEHFARPPERRAP